MRSVCLLMILVIAVHASDNLVAESCPSEKCVPASHCETVWVGAECANKQKTCCSVVKEEKRTLCSHHWGECMGWCNPDLQRPSTDCPSNKKCCVLV